jgi:hypothetical protein
MRHAGELRAAGRIQRAVEEKALERFLECGDPHYGFARARLIRKVYEADPLECPLMAYSVEKLEIARATNFGRIGNQWQLRLRSCF